MVKVLFSRPRLDDDGKAVGYDAIDAAKDGVQSGDLLYVTAPSELIRGHLIRSTTDLANALGCDATVVVDADIDRKPVKTEHDADLVEEYRPQA